MGDTGVHGSVFGSPSAQAFKSPHKGTGNSKNRVSLCLNFAENDKFRVLGGIYIVREPEYLN